jgi:L-ascorbate metabolism protein UlaG (beta-lactamase superfamily)
MLWLIVVPVLLLIPFLYISFNPHFGEQRLSGFKERYSQSKQWDGRQFNNLEHTSMNIGPKEIPGLLRQQFTNTKGRAPERPIPIEPFDNDTWNRDSNEPQFIWYGHSVILLQVGGKNILIDPMLGPNAAPIAPFKVRRFSNNTLDIIDSLPHLDAILMSHDHYDHLDYPSIQRLRHLTDTFLVALGVGRHLEKWGVPSGNIQELDWWDDYQMDDVRITFTPSRHFSGRGIADRSRCLWGGFAFTTGRHRIYWSGDGGYGSHFKEVGEKLGPFDFGFMECGQFNTLWHQIHMFPEEAVRAAIDAGVTRSIPVHWGGFTLALHHWKEPGTRYLQAATDNQHRAFIAVPGQIHAISDSTTVAEPEWWLNMQ